MCLTRAKCHCKHKCVLVTVPAVDDLIILGDASLRAQPATSDLGVTYVRFRGFTQNALGITGLGLENVFVLDIVKYQDPPALLNLKFIQLLLELRPLQTQLGEHEQHWQPLRGREAGVAKVDDPVRSQMLGGDLIHAALTEASVTQNSAPGLPAWTQGWSRPQARISTI